MLTLSNPLILDWLDIISCYIITYNPSPDSIEKQGDGPLIQMLSDLGGWPVLEQNFGIGKVRRRRHIGKELQRINHSLGSFSWIKAMVDFESRSTDPTMGRHRMKTGEKKNSYKLKNKHDRGYGYAFRGSSRQRRGVGHGRASDSGKPRVKVRPGVRVSGGPSINGVEKAPEAFSVELLLGGVRKRFDAGILIRSGAATDDTNSSVRVLQVTTICCYCYDYKLIVHVKI